MISFLMLFVLIDLRMYIYIFWVKVNYGYLYNGIVCGFLRDRVYLQVLI